MTLCWKTISVTTVLDWMVARILIVVVVIALNWHIIRLNRLMGINRLRYCVIMLAICTIHISFMIILSMLLLPFHLYLSATFAHDINEMLHKGSHFWDRTIHDAMRPLWERTIHDDNALG